ncbi:MAG TPA: hypothetical protein VFV75_06940 [Candidatus Polarisedimenticolaceae bacterium]|nr:hypothetical protein [Candidatus Polarisedimenticolaceae bacterium]
MSGALFPTLPRERARTREGVVRVVRRPPLAAICELLSVSIHEVINDPRTRIQVRALYKVSRWIENETWLRRALH